MGERTTTLAAEFGRLNGELIAAVELCSGKQWQARCEGEDWSVGVTAHHVAEYNAIEAGLAQTVSLGKPLPLLTWDVIHQMNAQHAQQHANCTKEETIELLRRNGELAVRTIQEIDDDRLHLTASAPWLEGEPISAQQLIEDILIVHVKEHLTSINATIAS
jgi:hypothetical protein